MLEKGFIGPIGDDIPSLIPLLLGLVIFFSTFTVTFNTFDFRNAEFDNDLIVMNISRIVQSNSYLVDYDEFVRHCDEVGLVNVKFIAILTENWVNPETANPDSETIFDLSIFENSERDKFVCTNVEYFGSPDFISDYIDVEEAAQRNVSSRVFPIVIEDEKIVKPLHIVVITWN